MHLGGWAKCKVDDGRANVESLERTLAPRGIEYVGLRYGALDAKVKKYNHAVAELQLRYLDKIVPDNAL